MPTKILEAEGVPVYLSTHTPGKVTIRVGASDSKGHGIRRSVSMTPGEARILAYTLLIDAERKDSH